MCLVAGLAAVAAGLTGCGQPEQSSRPAFVHATPGAGQGSAPVPSEPVTPSQPPIAPAGKSPAPSAKPSSTPRTTAVRHVFPVKASDVDYHPTHGKYPATDIFADCGEPVVAAADGVVLEVSLKDTYVKGEPDGPRNGGLSVSLLGDDGVRYYGSHLTRVRSGIKAGVRVRAGDRLGDVGRTGNANGVCHLHFGISPPCARVGDWKTRRGVIWPATFLDSWRKGGNKSPVAKVRAWEQEHHCKP
jgi:murein DD-endopeptidase MepM/ murein hydrolase activator NlpD